MTTVIHLTSTAPATGSTLRILTPDQRPRVFLSSTLQELAPERAAARAAIERLRLIPVMFELGARPHPARALYRAYLAQSHVFVGLYFQRYGWVAPGEEISGLEDEYRLSRGLPRLVYLKTPAPEQEPRLRDLLDTVRTDDTVSYKSFSSPEELESLLTDDLAVLMAERFLLGDTEEAYEGEVQQRATLSPRRPIPTPINQLVGRETELAELQRLLTTGSRLLTVVGPGGIGKTRLALEAARQAAVPGADTVAFVPLEAIDDPAAVMPAVAASIGLGLDGGVPVLDALSGAFGDRPFVLILDNFEQVLPAATDVAELLSRCPGVVVLVTSRTALRVRGETLLPLGPLSLPDGDATDSDSASVRLFIERARAVRPEFSMDDPADAAAVAEMCRRLDGIPLAIELAAGRSRLLPPRALLDRLGSALDLGVGAADLPARQRTLRDTLAWSEQLLNPQERSLLAALSIFTAPWTIGDAERIAPPAVGDVFEATAALVENSLVSPATTAPGEPRFRMFDSVRAYAAERLEAQGDRDAVEEAFYVGMIEQVPDYAMGVRSPSHARWQAEFRLVWPDLRRAWALAVDRGDGERSAAVAQLIIPLWLEGRHSEVEELLAQSVDLAARTHPTGHGEVVLIAAYAAFYLGQYERVAALLSDLESGAIPLPREQSGVGAMKQLFGFLAAGAGDLVAAERLLTESSTLFRESADGSPWLRAFTHNGLGSLKLLRGEAAAAAQEFDVSRHLAESSGNVGARMQALVFRAAIALADGHGDEARSLLHEAVPLVELQPFYEGNGYCLEVAAHFGLRAGKAQAAARALGLAKALRDLIGAKVWALLEEMSAAVHVEVRDALGDEAYESAFAEGQQLDPRTAAITVLGLLDTH